MTLVGLPSSTIPALGYARLPSTPSLSLTHSIALPSRANLHYSQISCVCCSQPLFKMLSCSRCTGRLLRTKPAPSSCVIGYVDQGPAHQRNISSRPLRSKFSSREVLSASVYAGPRVRSFQTDGRGDSASEVPLPNARWLSELYTKLRKAPNHEELLEELKSSATGLMLGVEGFGMTPFHTEPVTWGDQDAMVSLSVSQLK